MRLFLQYGAGLGRESVTGRRVNVLLSRSSKDRPSGSIPEDVQDRADPVARGPTTSEVCAITCLYTYSLPFSSGRSSMSSGRRVAKRSMRDASKRRNEVDKKIN